MPHEGEYIRYKTPQEEADERAAFGAFGDGVSVFLGFIYFIAFVAGIANEKAERLVRRLEAKQQAQPPADGGHTAEGRTSPTHTPSAEGPQRQPSGA